MVAARARARRLAQGALKRASAGADRLLAPPRGAVVLIYHRVGRRSTLEVDLPERTVRGTDRRARRHRPGRDARRRTPGPPGPTPRHRRRPGGGHVRRRHRRLRRRGAARARRAQGAGAALRGHRLHRLRPRVPRSRHAALVGRRGRRARVGARHDRVAHAHPRAVRPSRTSGGRRGTRPFARTRSPSVSVWRPRTSPTRRRSRVRPPPIARSRARFRSAALAGTRPNPYGATDPYRLHRSPVQVADGMRWFERKLAGGMRVEDDVRRLANRARYVGATS